MSDEDPILKTREDCRVSKCAAAWADYHEVCAARPHRRPPTFVNALRTFSWAASWSFCLLCVLTSCTHPRPAPQCTVRVNKDHKDNPEAQCTAQYLDFFKCADACQAKALWSVLK